MRVREIISRFGPWLLVVGSTAGLTFLVLTMLPSPLLRLLFLALFFTGSFGAMHLVLRALYSPEAQRRDPHRPVREGLMMAGFLTLCAWLQILRILTLINALLLLGVLAFVEAFWIFRTEEK